MTIHMIRYRVPADSDNYLINDYLPQWLVTHTAWSEADNQAPSPRTINGVDIYQADWRFDWSASKSVLTANLVAYTQAYSPWHHIQYHECDHDEEQRNGCSWDDEWVNGNVPSEIL